MLVSPAEQAEIQYTIEVAFGIINQINDDDQTLDTRKTLADGEFSRAADASEAAVERLAKRLTELAPLIGELPDLDAGPAAERINAELAGLPIAPAIVDHGGVGPHMHWTRSSTSFDDQVVADILMAVAQELCTNGTSRFGRCAATDCDDLFFDGTRNKSRRFCVDPRCASRTHTADHRARSKDS